jgi:hypothetical protein
LVVVGVESVEQLSDLWLLSVDAVLDQVLLLQPLQSCLRNPLKEAAVLSLLLPDLRLSDQLVPVETVQLLLLGMS